MIKVNTIQTNSNLNRRKYISFGEGNMNNITPNVAILALQNPNAKINFENDLKRSSRSDMVQNRNFVSAFVNKIGRAISEIKRTDSNDMQNINPDVYNHISYCA